MIDLSFFALALAASRFDPGYYGWRCEAQVQLGNHRALIWREYEFGQKHGVYHFQVLESEDWKHRTSWSISSRPLVHLRSAGIRFEAERSAVDDFSEGPDHVSIQFSWPVETVGPIWVHYWGDGRFAGSEMLISAKDLRRHRPPAGQSTFFYVAGLQNRAILRELSNSVTWTVVAVDAKGKELVRKSFDMPSAHQAQAVFDRARSSIDQLQARFAIDHRPIEADGVLCSDNHPPEATI